MAYCSLDQITNGIGRLELRYLYSAREELNAKERRGIRKGREGLPLRTSAESFAFLCVKSAPSRPNLGQPDFNEQKKAPGNIPPEAQ
jgi:hypothetical protein